MTSLFQLNPEITWAHLFVWENICSFLDIILSRYLDGLGIIGKSVFYRTLTHSYMCTCTSIMSSAISVQLILASSIIPRKIQRFDANQQTVLTLVHTRTEKLTFSWLSGSELNFILPPFLFVGIEHNGCGKCENGSLVSSPDGHARPFGAKDRLVQFAHFLGTGSK